MVARPGRRTVCGMLVGAGLSRLWHHSRAHWFFSHARWSAEQVGLVLVGLIVTGLLPAGVPVLVAVDDTLLRRSGRKVAGAAWCYDGARKGPKGGQTSWGTCFVVVGIVVTLPMCDRPVCRHLRLPRDTGGPGPRVRHPPEGRLPPRADHHRPAHPRRPGRGPLRRPVVDRGRVRRREADHRRGRGT